MTRHSVLHISAGIFILLLALLCSSAYGDQRFSDNSDGTVTDHQLGVMWAKSDNGADIDWKQARAYATSRFGAGLKKKYGNWRLPTLEELQSLYGPVARSKGYTAECGLLVKIDPAFRLSCVLIWASDTALGSHMAYNFNIGNEFIVPAYDIKGCRVLPVRTIK